MAEYFAVHTPPVKRTADASIPSRFKGLRCNSTGILRQALIRIVKIHLLHLQSQNALFRQLYSCFLRVVAARKIAVFRPHDALVEFVVLVAFLSHFVFGLVRLQLPIMISLLPIL